MTGLPAVREVEATSAALNSLLDALDDYGQRDAVTEDLRRAANDHILVGTEWDHPAPPTRAKCFLPKSDRIGLHS